MYYALQNNSDIIVEAHPVTMPPGRGFAECFKDSFSVIFRDDTDKGPRWVFHKKGGGKPVSAFLGDFLILGGNGAIFSSGPEAFANAFVKVKSGGETIH